MNSLETYRNDPHAVGYSTKIEESVELIRQFGTSVAQYNEFGTEDDAKAVAATWAGAKSAMEELEDLEHQIADYALGEAFYGSENDTIDLAKTIFRNGLRYQEAAEEAAGIHVDAQRDHDFSVIGKARELANNEHEEYFDRLDPDPEELKDEIEELVEDLDYEF